MAEPVTLAQLRDRKKAPTAFVDIVLDEALADRHNDIKEQVDVLQMRLRSVTDVAKAAELEAELDEAKDSLAAVRQEIEDEGAVQRFVFSALSPVDYDALVNEHKPSQEQQKEARRLGGQLQFDPVAFPRALVAACIKEPAASPDEVESMWKDPAWNAAELSALFSAALQANEHRRGIDLGNV